MSDIIHGVKSPWHLLGSLTEPQRRRLYGHVRSQREPVTREAAAAACGVSHKLAAFHLDKLVEVGLLEVVPTPAGPRRRGRGRPPKAYRPTGAEVAVSLPERRYELLGEILVDSVATGPDRGRRDALAAGRRRGEELAQQCDHDAEPVASLLTVLQDLGAEPRQLDGRRLALDNCPFRTLARRRPELVCGMCRALCEGLTDGLGLAADVSSGAPQDRCCVVIAT